MFPRVISEQTRQLKWDVPLPETRIYLNAEHLQMGKLMLKDDTITCISQSYIFFQLQELYNTLKEGKVKDTVGEIISLQENDSVPVINNLNLSRLLHDLADSMTTSINNANHTAAKLLSQYLYN